MTDFNQAIHDPSETYKTPQDVLKDDTLTKEQKIEILKQWAYDARLLAVAEEENMRGDSSSTMLSRVHQALLELGIEL